MLEEDTDYVILRGAFLKIAICIINSPEGKKLYLSLVKIGQSPAQAAINTLQNFAGPSNDIEQIKSIFEIPYA